MDKKEKSKKAKKQGINVSFFLFSRAGLSHCDGWLLFSMQQVQIWAYLHTVLETGPELLVKKWKKDAIFP